MAKTRRPALKTIYGQPSYTIQTQQISMSVSQHAGCVAPVRFYRDTNTPIEPLAIAPWWKEKMPPGTPPVIKALRGDFFCMPFGGSKTAYKGIAYPPHGETANRNWQFQDFVQKQSGKTLHLCMDLNLQKGRVEKALSIVEGQNVIYSRHRISKLSGPMSFSHHATLQFPDRPGAAKLSFSRFIHAATFYERVESPDVGTYSSLKPNSVIKDLTKVPLIDGTTTDLTRYPNRRGYEDIAMICADPTLELAWSAATFAQEHYVWFNLKNPKILTSTVLWFSNKGRYYAPWNGRHINVMGMEEGTTFWGDGIANSAKNNDFTKRGIQTCHRFRSSEIFDVPVIMGVARIPRGFQEVLDIQVLSEDHIRLIGHEKFKVDVAVNTDFLKSATIEDLIL